MNASVGLIERHGSCETYILVPFPRNPSGTCVKPLQSKLGSAVERDGKTLPHWGEKPTIDEVRHVHHDATGLGLMFDMSEDISTSHSRVIGRLRCNTA